MFHYERLILPRFRKILHFLSTISANDLELFQINPTNKNESLFLEKAKSLNLVAELHSQSHESVGNLF